MDMSLLQTAVIEIKSELEQTISTATYKDKHYENGQRAKEALIRSQNLIMKIHEVVKISLDRELKKFSKHHTIYPPLGKRKPELAISGYIKRKKQDIVVLFGRGEQPSEIWDYSFLHRKFSSTDLLNIFTFKSV